MATEGTAPEVFYEVAMQRLSEQMGHVDALDSKVATVFAFANAILPIYGGLLTFSDKSLPPHSWGLLAFGLLAYVLLLFFLYHAYQVRRWDFRPHPPTFQELCLQHDDLTMKLWVARECVLSIKRN